MVFIFFSSILTGKNDLAGRAWSKDHCLTLLVKGNSGGGCRPLRAGVD
jgi:hypothetical protein